MAILVAATRAAAEVAKRTSTSKTVRAAAEVIASPKRAGRRLAALAVAGGFAVMMLMTAVFGGGVSAVHPSCAVESVVVFDGELEQVLATIRTLESGHDYQAINNGNGYNRATGAYQFLRSSWASYGGYPEAWQAPRETQDAKAAEWATAILQEHGGDVGAVPVAWYIGHVPAPGSPRWDTVPVPSAGNTADPPRISSEMVEHLRRPCRARRARNVIGVTRRRSGRRTCIRDLHRRDR